MNKVPSTMKAYESFSAWKSDQSPRNQELIDALADAIENLAPHLTAGVKWGQGCWADQGAPKVFIHAEPDYVQLGFYQGSTLDDPHGLLEGKAKYVRHVKVREPADATQAGVSELIAQATA